MTLFNDKRVLVTGGSSGIGAAVAAGFARQGAKVAIHYHSGEAAARELAAALEQEGHQVVVLGADLAEQAGPAQLVSDTVAALGGLDILVNNAGGMVRREPFATLDDELYEAVMDLNVRSVIRASQAAIPHLKEARSGAIINLGSIAGIDGGGPGSGHYACAKAYVHNLTRHMARDLASSAIRVNAVAPGVIDTPFHAATPPERMEAMRKSVHLGRVGTPEDCVWPVLFLASDEMSGYVTGQILHVNGGQYMP
jgi:3-oxoacyl-[acyl-carrier protein] reductase